MQPIQETDGPSLKPEIIGNYNAATSWSLARVLNMIAYAVIAVHVFFGLFGLVLGSAISADLRWPISFAIAAASGVVGYLGVLGVRVVAQGLLVLTQIEINTQR